jgi:hypothetical protein
VNNRQAGGTLSRERNAARMDCEQALYDARHLRAELAAEREAKEAMVTTAIELVSQRDCALSQIRHCPLCRLSAWWRRRVDWARGLAW